MREGSTRSVAPWLLVAPMVIGLLAFAVYPLIYLILLSASRSLLGQTFQEWVGLANFRQAVGDDVFGDSLVRSVGFAVPVSLLEVALGLAIALLLQRSVRGGHSLRTLMLLPLMTPPIMVAVAWRLMLSPVGGLVNNGLRELGLTDGPVSFLGSSRWAFPSVAVADAWQWTPFVILLAFAALQAQPEEVYQAALVDGGTTWRIFWTITLPMMVPALVAILLLRMILAFKLFDLVYILTAGGPGFDTTVGTFAIYRIALQQFNVGYAAAQTIIFGILVGIVTLPLILLRDWAVKSWA